MLTLRSLVLASTRFHSLSVTRATALFPRRARALKEAFFDERERERDGFDGDDDDFGWDTKGGLVGTNEREKKAL